MNINDFTNRLQNQIDRHDFEDVLKLVGNTVLSEIGIRFQRQEDPSGQPWAPIHYYSKRLRRDRDSQRGDQILRDTGALLQGFAFKTEKTLNGGAVVVYNNQNYFRKHQLGVGVKQRMMLDTEGVNEDEQNEVQSVIEDYYDNYINDIFR